MIITRSTTVDDYIAGTGCWQDASPTERTNLARALRYFVRHVPLHVLNEPDHSSPWGPVRGRRTRLLSWLQAIAMSNVVNPSRVLWPDQRLRQFRVFGEPMTRLGNWFTWESTPLAQLALPAGQTVERVVRVTRIIWCLECTVGDAFAGWARPSDRPFADYRHGGGRQLFIYRDGIGQLSLERVEGVG